MDLVGLLQMVFIHNSVQARINKVQTEKIKLGLMNQLGNKGSTNVKYLCPLG